MSHPFFSRIGCDALGGVKSPREWLPALPALPAESLDVRQYPRLQRSFPKRTLATFAPQWRVGSAVFKCWSWAMRRRTALSVALFGMRRLIVRIVLNNCLFVELASKLLAK
jgi:hypothetical protein